MPPVCRAGMDSCTGHGSFPPRGMANGSPNVFTNGAPTRRQGDSFYPHGSPSPSPPHGAVEASGSGTVFCNGRPINRTGDPVSCGGSNASGSGNVFAGG